MSANTEDVAVVMGKVKEVKSEAANMSTTTKMAHVGAIAISGVIALFVGIVLADGTSVIRLKNPKDLPVITSYEASVHGIKYRADELLGPTYGIGLHHDQSGSSWYTIMAGSTLATLETNLGLPVIAAALPSVIATDDLKHPVPFLSCDDLQMAGLAAMYLGFIAEIVGVLMIIFHSLVLAGMVPAKPAKMLGGLIWFVLTAGFLTVIYIAVGIYTATWTCKNTIVPSVVISEHFDLNYGFAFAVLGFVSSLLVLMLVLTLTSTEENAPAPKLGGAIAKTLGGLIVGFTVCAVGSVIVLGGNGYFNESEAVPTDFNPCAGRKPIDAGPGDKYFKNVECVKDGLVQVLEQAGANVTKGYKGLLDAGNREPITDRYDQTDLCPVNVHWHLGAEHLSVGQFDEKGSGPYNKQANDASFVAGESPYSRRQLAADKQVRRGFSATTTTRTSRSSRRPTTGRAALTWSSARRTRSIGHTRPLACAARSGSTSRPSTTASSASRASSRSPRSTPIPTSACSPRSSPSLTTTATSTTTRTSTRA